MRFLVVDDDELLVTALVLGLQANWPEAEVVSAPDGRQALEVFHEGEPDLVVLDVNMPGMDGFEVLREIRHISQNVLVLMLTVHDEQHLKMTALDGGADDYVTKPFGSGELVARIRALLRRQRIQRNAEYSMGRIVIGDIAIDKNSGSITVGDTEARLTPTETRIVCVLARRPGDIISRERLLIEVWGPEYRNDPNLVKTYIRRLRHKIEQDPSNPRVILTEGIRGYRLATV